MQAEAVIGQILLRCYLDVSCNNKMYMCHDFFPMLKCKAGLQKNESWCKNKLTAVVLIKLNF